MNRYTVWHSTGKRDGDVSFDSLTKAQHEFDDQSARDDVSEVEMIDNIDPANPVTLQRYSAAEAAA